MIVMIQKKLIDRHFLNFTIAGFTYWEGCVAIQELKIGSRLRLVREADNKFNPYAVAIYYENTKLGFIPRGRESAGSAVYGSWLQQDLRYARAAYLSRCASREAGVGDTSS